ncbi:unnamed protein product [Mycena citricolor]|uniref:Uncharacterized protein n=1 Tax=Mycena citricolor TaxID=2018698 RepID=A0AAD2K2M3_9AGAR|nr:unnamed protein product [Mycena citricolor]
MFSDSKSSSASSDSLWKLPALRRRTLFVGCLALVVLSVGAFSRYFLYAAEPHPISAHVGMKLRPGLLVVPPAPAEDPLGPSSVLKGPPTQSFRDNLKPGQKYITSWTSAGWTNDVITYINLIYLGLITDRIPIIPPFLPSHVGSHVPPIPFGEVFDVPRLRKELGVPVLEWKDVKNSSSLLIEELGCWNLWEAVQDSEAYPRPSRHPRELGLDISYTKAPNWIKMIPDSATDRHSTFWSIASLAFPETRNAHLVPPLPSPIRQEALSPDEDLLCYDYLYYVSAHRPFEFGFDYSPAWRFVGTHMHWTPRLEELADDYLRLALGVPSHETIPPFVSVHVRHYDFEALCNDLPTEECYASLPVIQRRVEELKADVLTRQGIRIHHVVLTSDERDPIWQHEAAQLGWFTPDHETTGQRYGEWYPVLIDAVIQSRGAAFVGTDRSTMSVIAGRRVEDWQKGPVVHVKWGTPSADDH